MRSASRVRRREEILAAKNEPGVGRPSCALGRRSASPTRRRGGPEPLPDPERRAAAPRARTRSAISALGAVPLQDPELAAGELGARGWRLVRGRGDRRERRAAGTSATTRSRRSGRRPRRPARSSSSTRRHAGSPARLRRDYLGTSSATRWRRRSPARTSSCRASERHPRLRVLLAHGGGALPRAARAPAPRARARRPPPRRLRGRRGLAAPPVLRHRHATRTSCATSSRSPAPTTCCSAPTTPSTWPTRGPPTRSPRPPLHPDDERAVLGGSAARLLGLETRA